MKKSIIKKHVDLFFLFVILNVSMGYSQQKTFICKGIVKDSVTNVLLENVRIFRIYDGDTLKLTSNAAGEFQVPAVVGAKLHFRKAGYAWQNVKIYDTKQQQVELVRSRPLSKKDIGEENYANTIMYYDGEVVPQKEWDDVSSMRKEEILLLEIISSEVTKEKNKIIFKSKP